MNPSPSPSPYDPAIESLENQIRHLQSLLESLKALRLGSDGSPLAFSPPGSREAESEVRHDTFFAMTIADAAKKYLSMMKATKSTAVIAEALERGGLKHSSKSFPTTLRSVLGPREEFTRVPNGDWGLSEWYPGQGRGKKAKPEKPKRKVARKKRTEAKSKATMDAALKPEITIEPEVSIKPGPQARVEAYLVTHHGATSREIADALGIRIQTVGLILAKLKTATAA